MSIRIEHLNYIYNPGTLYEKYALRDINLEIPDGQFIGMIGHTGSGKSTLIQHLNGLFKAASGKVLVDGKNIYDEGYDMKRLRQKVGLVFQYPEYQLFETDVITDVKFGPKNLGLSEEEAKVRAKEALALVGIDEKLFKSSPFELSGGQKRRVAFAAVFAMDPEVVVIDEPLSGLDEKGQAFITQFLKGLKGGKHLIIVSTHNRALADEIADVHVHMAEGRIVDFEGEN